MRSIAASEFADAQNILASDESKISGYFGGEIANDPLLDCLDYLVRHHERSITRSALVAGLPLVDGHLTPKLFAQAAVRAGLTSKIAKRPLSRLSSLLLPAILFLKDDSCVVLLERSRKSAKVFFPETGRGASEVELRELEKEYSGYGILVKPEYRPSSQDESAKESRYRSWFWGAVAPLWPSYLQVLVAAAVVNILALAAPLFIMNVYDRVLPNKAISTLWVLAIGITLAITFDFIFRSLRNSLIGNAGRRADVILASRIFQHVLKLDSNSRPMRTGEFANKIRDYEVVREFFTSNTIVTLTDFAFIWLYIYIIYQIAGVVAVVPAIALVLVLTVGLILQFPLARTVAAAQMEAAHRHSMLFEAISGLDTIKCWRAEGQMQREWEQFVAHNAKTAHRLRAISAFGLNFTALVQQLVTVAIVVVGVYLFDQGEITPGALIAAVILAGRGVAPLGQIASTLARSQQAFHSFRTLNQIMATPEEGDDQVRHIDKAIESGNFKFDGVSFEYPGGGGPAIREATLKVEAGERVGLIGKIGSGKTTFGRLLVRLYVPTSGSLLIDGVDIRQYHPSEVRRQVAFVSQESTLFSGSVRDNIVLGVPSVSDEAVVRASELSGVSEFVATHPLGFNMPVGEGGRSLSSGQKQAVALARAFLFQPAILFLDEPTGAMDMASEQAFVNRLQAALMPGQTLLLATHRYRPLSLVDRLIVLDNGRVIADGPKDEILNRLKAVRRGKGRP